MDYNYFFNTYGFQPSLGFDSREKQLKDAGVDTEGCQMFGYGYYDCPDTNQNVNDEEGSVHDNTPGSDPDTPNEQG